MQPHLLSQWVTGLCNHSNMAPFPLPDEETESGQPLISAGHVFVHSPTLPSVGQLWGGQQMSSEHRVHFFLYIQM